MAQLLHNGAKHPRAIKELPKRPSVLLHSVLCKVVLMRVLTFTPSTLIFVLCVLTFDLAW